MIVCVQVQRKTNQTFDLNEYCEIKGAELSAPFILSDKILRYNKLMII